MPPNPQKKVQGFDEFWASNPQNRGHQPSRASRGLLQLIAKLPLSPGANVLASRTILGQWTLLCAPSDAYKTVENLGMASSFTRSAILSTPTKYVSGPWFWS